MPKGKGAKKRGKSPYRHLKSKVYTHAGGRKGKSSRITKGRKKKKHGRR